MKHSPWFKTTTLTAFFLGCIHLSPAQKIPDSIVRPLTLQYQKGNSHNKWWGIHYRKEWSTPVSFKTVLLDTLLGGLTPYAKGGGRQSKNLRLKDKSGREYVLRSLNKSLGGAVPKNLRGTFVEDIMNDQASISHPYSALTIPGLAQAADIYHTQPRIFYLPDQAALDSFNKDFGNDVYLFEQRPDENWEDAENFGNAKNIIGTNKLRERLLEDSDNRVDQRMFARARLFDMLIGDWSRHDDQWRWAEFKEDGRRLYKPIPRDRDMAYSLFDGKALKMAISVSGLDHLQSFGSGIDDIEHYNFAARNIDLHLTNELEKSDWIAIAEDIQKRLTNTVIHDALLQFPPEVYPLSGPAIESYLKNRRDNLVKYAGDYFEQLSRYPAVTGSEKSEEIRVEFLNDTATRVTIHRIRKEKADADHVFQRTFTPPTREIVIYGIGGEDEFNVLGESKNGIKVRLVGGPGKDVYADSSSVRKMGRQVKIYDNRNNTFIRGRETSLHLSENSSVHHFEWDAVRYNKSGIKPIAFFNNADRLFVGLKYSRTRFRWRKEPFANKQSLDARYSISQKAPSITYQGIFTDLVGKLDMDVLMNYDWMRWTNFHGLGNETILETTDRDFYRLRSKEFFVSAGLSYRSRNRHRLSLLPYFQTITFKKDEERFVSQKSIDAETEFYHTRRYLGANLEYVYQHINDSVLPEKGIAFIAGVDAFSEFDKRNISAQYAAQLQFLIPVHKNLGLNFKYGASLLSGSPEFFRYNSIGGSETFRGYQRNRFYGNTAVFGQNELRWIPRVKTHWYSGKMGLFGFFDVGRVWLNGERSTQWHTGYGPGIILSPFDKFSVWLAYGFSKEDNNFHFRIIRPF